MSGVVRVAIVGPESCGKTTLAIRLAARLEQAGVRAAVVNEYAREYYACRPYRPTPEAVLEIARGQLAAEARAGRQPGLRVLLCDSTVLTCRIWSEVAFGAVPEALAALCRPRDYALTLLPRPDIPWAPDPLRTHPQARGMLLERYRRALAEAGAPVVEIEGDGAAREDLAWQALCRMLPELLKI